MVTAVGATIRLPIAIISCAPAPVQIVVPVVAISVVIPSVAIWVVMASVVIRVIPSMVTISQGWRRNKTGNNDHHGKQ